MQHLKDAMRKNFAHKHLGRNVIGSVAINTVNKRISDHICSPGEGRIKGDFIPLEGYVRFNKIFLKTTDPQLKIELFKQKNSLLDEVNKAVHHLGYTTTIVEIRFK